MNGKRWIEYNAVRGDATIVVLSQLVRLPICIEVSKCAHTRATYTIIYICM